MFVTLGLDNHISTICCHLIIRVESGISEKLVSLSNDDPFVMIMHLLISTSERWVRSPPKNLPNIPPTEKHFLDLLILTLLF